MNYIIRQTREEDFEAVAALLMEAGLIMSYFDEKGFRAMLSHNPGFCFVAEADERVVGNVFASHNGAFKGNVEKLAVSGPYRRQGIGFDLLRTAYGALKSAGIPLIYAHVEKANEASIGLFRSAGFQIRDTHYLMDIGNPR